MYLIAYILRRLGIGLVVLVGVSIVSFTAVYLLPGDPISARFPQIREEERARIREAMGLDQPLHIQYASYVQAIAQGDLGYSYNTGNRVAADLKARFPASMELVMTGFVIAVIVGVPLGVVAAVWKNQTPDHLSRIITVSSLSIPVFWLGLILIYIFFYKLDFFPGPVGRLKIGLEPPQFVTGLYTVDALIEGNLETFFNAVSHIILPGITLALSIIAPIARITRSEMSEVLEEDYVSFARAIGVPEHIVILRDALGNAMIPILTMLGYIVGFLVAGDALVELVFSWPGVGRYAVQAVATSDHAALQGFMLIIAVLIALINLIVDITYSLIDPRIRQE